MAAKLSKSQTRPGAGQRPGWGKARGGAKDRMGQCPGRSKVRGGAQRRSLRTASLERNSWSYFPLHPGSDASSRAFARPVASRRWFSHGPPSWRSKTKRLWLGWLGGGTHSRGDSGLGVGFCLALPPAASRRGRGMEVG